MTANVAVAAPIPTVTVAVATVTVTVPNAASTSVTTQPMSFRYGTRVGQLWPRGGSQITQTGISSHSGLSGLTDANAHPASSVSASTAAFGNVLTPTESTVQLALDQIDDAAAQTAGVVMGAY